MQQQMAYDRASTVFSPDGRLFQVEYAREAVKRGTTALGVRFEDGVALIVDKRVQTSLAVPASIEKIFVLDSHVGCATSGLVADARSLVDRARVEAQMNRVTYDEPVPVGVLVKRICDVKQACTQFGGTRPYGTALLVAGVDESGPRLFETDPSGALIEYHASAVGSGRQKAMEYLEEHYKVLDEAGAIQLGLLAIKQAAEGKPNAEALEIAVVTTEREFTRLSEDAVAALVKEAY